MQYNINIHQLSAIYHNHMDVDLNDVATLSYIKETISNPRVITEVQGGVVWYWISYPWIQSALPLVYKSVKIDTVYRHIKRLEGLGYLSVNQSLSKKTGKTFMRLGEKCQTLLFSDAKSLDLSEMDKTSEANLAKYISIGEKSEAPIGNKSEPNTIIVSNTKESLNNFYPINSSLNETMINKDSASVREEEIDCFANNDDLTHDFVPDGIQPSKKTFVAPEREKTYKYPPFMPNSPADIKNEFEFYVDQGRVADFEFAYFSYIAWREIKSDKNERPWAPHDITPDLLNEMCKGLTNTPVKKYIGVKAYKNGQYVEKEYHYINLFNYDWLSDPKVGEQFIKPIMDSVTSYCSNYHDLLRELYEKKKANKGTKRTIKVNKYLGPDYETIEDIRE